MHEYIALIHPRHRDAIMNDPDYTRLKDSIEIPSDEKLIHLEFMLGMGCWDPNNVYLIPKGGPLDLNFTKINTKMKFPSMRQDN